MLKTLYHYNDMADEVIVERVQDCTPILDANHRKRCESDGFSESRDMRELADIPNVIIEQWLKEGIDIFNPEHAKAVRAKLNGDYKYLRSSHDSGHIGIIVKGKR